MSMPLSEAQFQKWLTDTATRLGWKWYHVPTPMRPISGGKFVPDARGRGLPDLVMLLEDPPRLLFVECKAAKGKLSDEQREFLRLARAVSDATLDHDGYRTVGAYSWRPGSEELIEAILRSGVIQ